MVDELQPEQVFSHAYDRTVSEDGDDSDAICLVVSGVAELYARYNTHVAAVVTIGVLL